MRNRRRFAVPWSPILTLLVALLPVLSACGRGREDGSVVLRFLERPDQGGGWSEIIQAFEAANPNIDVQLVEGPSATDTRESMYATAMLAGQDVYDLIFMDVIWVPKFASRQWLLPLDDLLPPSEREAFFPGDIEGSIYEGKLYRIPVRSDAGVLFYRSDLVPAPPQTFEELDALARSVAQPPERWGFVFQGTQYEGLVCTFLEVLWGHGGDLLDSQGGVVLDRPEGVAALRWLASTVGRIAPPAVMTYQEEESRQAFQEGRAVFLRNWPYVWSKAQEEGSPVRGNVGISRMPHAAGASSAATLGGWGFGIARTCKHPEAARAFVRFATSAESMKILDRRNGAIPARQALYDDAELVQAHPYYPDLREVLLAARPRPVHPKYAQISSILQAQLSAALVGRAEPEEAIRNAAGEIRRVIAAAGGERRP